MKKALIAIIALIVIAAGVFLYRSHAQQEAEAAVRETVTGFGSQLQKVSLLAPTVAADVEKAYAPYVDPALLAKWKSDPSTTPGRETSSPWPDHINIDYVHKVDASTYEVKGYVALMTSNEVAHGGVALKVPVVMTLKKEDGSWKIASYAEQGAFESAPAAASTTPKR